MGRVREFSTMSSRHWWRPGGVPPSRGLGDVSSTLEPVVCVDVAPAVRWPQSARNRTFGAASWASATAAEQSIQSQRLLQTMCCLSGSAAEWLVLPEPAIRHRSMRLTAVPLKLAVTRDRRGCGLAHTLATCEW